MFYIQKRNGVRSCEEWVSKVRKQKINISKECIETVIIILEKMKFD